MTIEPLQILLNTGLCDEAEAVELLTALEAQGCAIYKKKVFKNGRRPNASQPLTEALKHAIRAYFHSHPNATQQEIAHVFNVNNGRVSEALSED